MRASPIHHLAALLSFALSAWALSPLPPGSEPPPATVAEKQPTLAELQNDAEFIVYGRIVRLDLDASANSGKYTAVIAPRRTWKGQSPELLTIEGQLYDHGWSWCGTGRPPSPFEFAQDYFVFLKQLPDGSAYRSTLVRNLQLPYHPAPSSLPGLFGGDTPPTIPSHERELVELLESLERAAGETTEADRLAALLEEFQIQLVTQRLAAEAQAKRDEAQAKINDSLARQADAFVAKARAELARALGHRNVAERKALLEKLQIRLPSVNSNEDMKVLKDEISAELSIVETYLSNGIKEFPPSTAQPAP